MGSARQIMSVQPRSSTTAVCAAIAIGLCGCGEGGGSSSPPPKPNLMSAPGQAAINAYYQASHNITLTASNGGNNYSVQLTYTPNSGTTMFNGQTVDSANISGNVYQNGTLIASTNSEIDYFTLNPYTDVGSQLMNGTVYAVVTSFTPTPTTLTVGDSGTVEMETAYHDSTKAVVDAMSMTTFSVNADTPTTIQYCGTDVVSASSGNPDNIVSSTEVDCYRIDASGNATLYSVALTVNGTTLTFH